MASQNGTFLLVDLQTTTVPYVAVVPDFWVQEGKCSYPKRRGEAAAMRRDKPNAKWLVYECIVRKQFNSYQAAKEKEIRACEQNELTTASEAESAAVDKAGKGCRQKYPNRRYSHTIESENIPESDDSGESSDGMYGPTQEMLPFIPIPSSLVGNATSFPVSGGQVSIPPQNHMDLPYRELAPNEQHPFFIATGGQENLDKSYASTPALRTFHTNAPMQRQEALVNRNSRQSTGLHLAGPPSQQASNSMPSQAPTPAQQGNWNALYAGTSSAGHQPIQDQPELPFAHHLVINALALDHLKFMVNSLQSLDRL